MQQGGTLHVSEIDQLAAADAAGFESAVVAALPLKPQQINIDLSETDFLDCGGLGALIAVRNKARRRNASVKVRVLNPAGAARRLFKLTRADSLFPVEGLESI